MKTGNKRSIAGFTLIEAIVVLVMVALLATFLYFYMGKIFWQSHVPRENLVRAKDLNQVMENIRADYKPYPVWKPNYVYYANDKIMPTAFSLSGQRYWYQCTTPGISGATEPDPWTTGVISDGATVKWTYQGYLMTLSDLRGYIGAPDPSNKKCATLPLPGEKCYDKSTKQSGYYVTERKWIEFDPNTKTELANESSNHNILKVTISAKDDSGNTVAAVTALFF